MGRPKRPGKNPRKNMNLSEQVFERLEELKAAREAKLRASLSWDVFLAELAEREELRKEKV